MKQLWAPWRSAYVNEIPEPTGTCIFCRFPQEPPAHFAKRHILFCDQNVFVILNRYPYNPGHVMVVPRLHTADPLEVPEPMYQAWMAQVRNTLAILKKTFHPQGVNIGMNLGKSAGAGIADHIHMHLVPRWEGDSNFMPVLSGTKVLNESLDAVYETLLPSFS